MYNSDSDKVEPARREAKDFLGTKVTIGDYVYTGFYRYWDGNRWIRTEGTFGPGHCVAVLENGSVLCAVDGYETQIEVIK